MRLPIVGLLGLVLFAFSPIVHAEGKAPPAKAEAKKDDKGDKDKGKDEKGDKDKDKDKGDKGKDEKGDKDKDKGDDEKSAKKPELPKVDKAAIKARAKAEREELKAKVGKHLAKGKDAALTEELKRHARRVAKLDRIMQVAKANNDTATEDRAKKLMDKEQTRHDKFIANLDKGAAK